ncbi:MAG TPA: aldolase/citrate lyase family protein [Solirubrobacteraceae bacterium]|nr:aldolase/citrate lyase family protein [Solirubrobacteraceae bacterium]
MGTTTLAGQGLRARWDADEAAFGLWAGIPTSLVAEMGAAAGYDYVCVDLQHGMSDEATMISMFQATQAAGSVPLARLAWNEPYLIMRALDVGAIGVIVPLIDNAAEAARAVEACRYPPVGRRSYAGSVRAQLVLGSSSPEALAGGVLCLAMIETREGLENVEEIAATPGLDGLYIGPSDLSLALGLHAGGLAVDAREDRPALAEAIERIRQACTANGLIAGIQCSSGAAASLYASYGFRLVTVGGDVGLFAAAISRELRAARGA